MTGEKVKAGTGCAESSMMSARHRNKQSKVSESIQMAGRRGRPARRGPEMMKGYTS